ncbi:MULTISPECIES: SDR family NAD(P)-dependent oxidoreductase [unclassified Lentimicrobium]|uniref:SDR family NAD(P)-dependent oxidoreductase n=1 Tax=unclassified Lentimicrobium TaxID=2677434 RepID=UPI001551D320|nr:MULTISPECIES: SDR family NAD(P)-dependent oxidoreductase [unclassified Lentimicrobium]NPD47619.1 SDR family NAD(P)-dependent oxidoreductase [Lentimicrobium sp. S6]NPD84713.1 SDR family NAD(P)-dependent oxidoreductase [Lentimicrobium sp. L6]
MDFKNKTIWITGASSGMGKATAIALSNRGLKIIISDRDLKGLKETAQEIENNGSKVRMLSLDMSDQEQILQSAQQIISEGEVIHGLYQFAGISQRSLTVETPIENDRKIMEVNFFGVITLAKAILPHMIKNGGGQMAVASSLVGKFGFPYRSAYSASKHALHGFFESILAENYDKGIRISMIMGGRIQTNISKFALNKEGKEHGKMDDGQANGISPEKAAKQIIKGIRKEKYEIPVGGKELNMLKIKRFLPGLAFKLARSIKPM